MLAVASPDFVSKRKTHYIAQGLPLVSSLNAYQFNPLSTNPDKMAKHTQKFRWQIADELFECVWLFCVTDYVSVIAGHILVRVATDYGNRVW